MRVCACVPVCFGCSGKSTFINYVAGKEIQKTGVAPTDDCFTVVIPGHSTADQDGPSVSCSPSVVAKD
jgi:hypothetical protein